MIAAITTSFKNSFESNVTIVVVSAPNTFLTPISFTRCEIANAESPNKPRHAIKIAIQANVVKIVSCLCSDSYSVAKFSSRNVY
jgi:hypothetical protein